MSNIVKRYEHIEELDTYFKEVKRYKPLTPEQERKIGERIQKGEQKAIDELVQHNLRFVVLTAKKYRAYTDVSFADLISEGNIGLIKAAKRYNPTINSRFISYAIWWIKSAINDCIEAYEGRNDTTTLTDTQLIKITEEDDAYSDINEDFEKKMSDIQDRGSAINELIECLEEREKRIITMFFGLDGVHDEMNLDEISKEMNLTKERIRQIKDGALVKLKCKALVSDEFQTYKLL